MFRVPLWLSCVLWCASEALAGGVDSRFTSKPIALKLTDGEATVASEFTKKDARTFDCYYKVFAVTLEKGRVYRIEQRGSDPKFDAYLHLEDASGRLLETDDDSGGDLHARIVCKAAKTGIYRIIASTGEAQETGAFTLEIGPCTDADEIKEVELKYRVNNFVNLSPAQRNNLVQAVQQRFRDKGGDLAVSDTRLAFQVAIEAEMEDIDLARDLYRAYLKIFAAASNKQLALSMTQSFAFALKNLDQIGKEFEVSGKTVQGKDFDLKNLKGKIVLVDFWGTWCGPCVAEIPNIARAHEKYHGKGFEVIGVSSDKNDGVVSKFLESRMIPWDSINVKDGRTLIDRHGVKAYPHTVLVDANGRIVTFRARGPMLERFLERLFEGK